MSFQQMSWDKKVGTVLSYIIKNLYCKLEMTLAPWYIINSSIYLFMEKIKWVKNYTILFNFLGNTHE